jgi:hypothetical protein
MEQLERGDIPTISSLKELEWKTLCWTFFAGKPLEPGEWSGTKNTALFPHLVRVVWERIEQIFNIEKWIQDEENYEWMRAEEFLIDEGIEEVWSPLKIQLWSFLLWPGEPPESVDEFDGEIYRYEWIDDVRWWNTPEDSFTSIRVRRFIEKIWHK